MDEESNDDPGLKKMVEATEKMDEAKEKMDEAKEKMDEAKEKMDEAKEKIDEATEKTEEGLFAMQLDENKTERSATDKKVTSMPVDESKNSEGGEGEGRASQEPAEKKRFVSVRKYFGRKEDIMIVDALTTGNIGKKLLIKSEIWGHYSIVQKWILISNLDENRIIFLCTLKILTVYMVKDSSFF
jgi:hypothetical protein